MNALTRSVAVVFAVTFAVTELVGQAPAPQPSPWSPGVLTVSPDSPVLSPAEEMKTFHLPPGYRVELVASEPMVQDPILMDWDPDGRMWLIEMPGYMPDMPAAAEREPNGRIVVLEDRNGDGVMDRRTVFLDHLILPRALKVLDHGVLVGEPPNLWLARDTNGDLKADTKELVTDTYGTLAAGPEHNANGLLWAYDNWMHTSEHDVMLRLKHRAPKVLDSAAAVASAFETRKTLSRGQWGLSMDDGGRIFRNTNEAALFVDYVPAPYYMRYPSMLRTRGLYDSLENRDVNTVWPVRPTRGVNRGYQTGVLRENGTLAAFTSVSAPTVYRGDRLPKELYGNVFVVEPAGNLVSRILVGDDGSTLKAAKAYANAEFLASTDERFRPVNLSAAPDGTLYLIDMYRGIIQHRNFITEYLRDHIVAHNLEQPTARGRIYRFVHTSTVRDRAPAMSRATPAALVAALSHANGWRRDTAQRLLVERADLSVVPALTKLATSAPDWRTRLHALWTLDGLDSLDQATALHALGDSARDVRVSGLRLSERWLNQAGPVRTAVLQRLDDADWAVRRQLAATLGELPVGDRAAPLATMIARHAGDPVTMDAILSGTKGVEIALLTRLLQNETQTANVEAGITMLSGTIARAGDAAAAQQVLAWVAEGSRPMWQRSALLKGDEVALLNAPLPGNPARAGGPPAAAAPCPTCPGARSGPGGASAFPSIPAPAQPTTVARGRGAAAGATQPGAGGNPNAGRTLRLTKAPDIVALTGGSAGELSSRLTAVLERLDWPGKASTGPAVTPLTAEEQQRFAAGREVYQNLCVACHQPDGRGREKVAPSLVGSVLALAPATVTSRILLAGKEGQVGLMPPLAGTLTDDQIAAVLTYVRREWGQTGSPVIPATVRDVRAQTSSRTRPWTDAELLPMIAGAR